MLQGLALMSENDLFFMINWIKLLWFHDVSESLMTYCFYVPLSCCKSKFESRSRFSRKEYAILSTMQRKLQFVSHVA